METLATFGVKGERDDRMQAFGWTDVKSAASASPSCVGLSPRILCQPQHTRRPREGVAGCGLAADTTTSLAQLGYDITPDSFIDALIPVVRATLAS